MLSCPCEGALCCPTGAAGFLILVSPSALPLTCMMAVSGELVGLVQLTQPANSAAPSWSGVVGAPRPLSPQLASTPDAPHVASVIKFRTILSYLFCHKHEASNVPSLCFNPRAALLLFGAIDRQSELQDRPSRKTYACRLTDLQPWSTLEAPAHFVWWLQLCWPPSTQQVWPCTSVHATVCCSWVCHRDVKSRC